MSELEGAGLARLAQAVTRRLGLQMEEARLDQLRDVGSQRLAALRHPPLEAWLARIEAGHPAEIAWLAERLTVGETYFFRNTNDLRAFVEVVLPERARARAAERRLRVLSAGCSSGEEPYTLAMLVGEIPALRGWDVGILGVDVNPAALLRARAGRYGAWSLRQTDPALRGRFFEGSGREVQVRAEVRAMVSFEQRNLAQDDDGLWVQGRYDVVFCRNVLMYFAPEVTRRVIDRIATALAPGGFLFLGHAETLRGISSRFHLRHEQEAFYYQLREGSAAEAPPRAGPIAVPAGAADPEPSGTEDWAASIHAASARIAALTAPPAPSAGPLGAAGAERQRAVGQARALDLARQERFGDALAALGDLAGCTDPDPLLLRAVLLASSGDPAAAEAVCARVLELDELSAEAHYVMALCREAAGDAAGAASHDHYALYLDPTFAMPRLHLGIAAARGGDREAARRELQRALVLLAGEDASRVLLLGGGFSRDALAELCRAELRAAGGQA